MTRPRKPSGPGGSIAIARELHDLVKDQLEQDVLGFLSGSTGQDPKLYLQRIAAATAALELLALVAGMAGEEDAERTPAEVLAESRALIADENRT